MIKWFCDLCHLEILAPEHPTRIAAYSCRKNRSEVDSGWNESDDIIRVFCHEKCAGTLEKEIKSALDNANRIMIGAV